MNQHCWRQLKRKHKGGREEDEGESALAAFGGVFYNCNKTGHKAKQCPEKDGGNNQIGGGRKGKFSGKCSNCRKIGHTSG